MTITMHEKLKEQTNNLKDQIESLVGQRFM